MNGAIRRPAAQRPAPPDAEGKARSRCPERDVSWPVAGCAAGTPAVCLGRGQRVDDDALGKGPPCMVHLRRVDLDLVGAGPA